MAEIVCDADVGATAQVSNLT